MGEAENAMIGTDGSRRRGRRRRTGRLLVVAALAIALFSAGGLGLWTNVRGEPSPSAARPGSVSQLVSQRPVVDPRSLEDAVQALRIRLEELPEDWRSWADLGSAYVQLARITADASYYPRAQSALERSLEIDETENVEAMIGMSSLAAARHDFAEALRWADRARRLDPGDADVYGVLGDAQLELGRYDDAFRSFQRMADLRPDLSSYARVSYARELQGDVAGAVEAMRLALDAAASPEDRAFAGYHIGELHFGEGRVDRAAEFFRAAAQSAPAYLPPQAGLARVAWTRGDMDRAIALMGGVAERYPSPEYVAELGDLYAAAGRAEDAREEYRVVNAVARLFRAGGVNVDLEIALFDADHGRPEAALEAARAEWARRKSVHVADALGWALHANGRDREALAFARKATRLGFRNASFLFHRGMIEASLGMDAAAREHLRAAIEISPWFSIRHAGEAERALADLRAA